MSTVLKEKKGEKKTCLYQNTRDHSLTTRKGYSATRNFFIHNVRAITYTPTGNHYINHHPESCHDITKIASWGIEPG
jgi:hypothetical protein